MSPDEVSLKEFIEVRLDALEARFDQRFEMTQAALVKADEAMLIRLENMNRFRAQILDERVEFMKRESCALQIKSCEVRLRGLETKSTFNSGRDWAVIACIGLVPTVIGILNLIRG